MPNSKAIRLLTILPFIFSTLFASAKTYYLSSSSGNDANTGTSTSSPWQSLNKLNSFSGFAPGDNILFMRGDTFYGSISIKTSGSSGNPITYSAYGTGAKPIITGFTSITAWTNLGPNIWESTNSVSTLSNANLVVINGVSTPMGRYPNTGYLTYQSHNSNISITSSSLTGSPNWTGADVVIKKERWAMERGTITNQYGGTINFTDDSKYWPTDGFGFFIQNDSRTLDQQNEWYYNPSTKKLRIYSTSFPTNVQIATVDKLVNADWQTGVGNYITFDNISFSGANSTAIYISYKNNSIVQNCDVNYAGEMGIYAESANFINVIGNNIAYTNSYAIFSNQSCSNTVINSNIINNTGLIAGVNKLMSPAGISSEGSNALVQYNSIDNSGYNGIIFGGSNVKVMNNFINHSCIVLDDGAGIYSDGITQGREITGNIVLNSAGTTDGTNAPKELLLGNGIFLDQGTSFVNVTGNTISGCNGAGIYVHSGTDITLNNNTSYANGSPNNFIQGGLMVQYDASRLLRNFQFNNNVFFAKTSQQVALFCYVIDLNDFKLFGSADNNYYVKPINDNNQIVVQGSAIAWPGYLFNPSSWKSAIGQDANAKGSPMSITSTDQLRFEYNASSSSKTISLGANYMDSRGVSYNGAITLAPYSSAVLIQNGPSTSNKAPSASAGSGQTITLPANSVYLSGSGNDSDGYISSYLWTQVSGPSSSKISNSASAGTSVTGLIQGVYKFALQVTDNNGATGSDITQITVNPQTLVGTWSANAGPDQTIALPINSVSLTGTSSDPTTYIASYAWSKTSGPAGGNVSSSWLKTITLTGLTQGVYSYQLQITDNNGVISTANVKVTVNTTQSVASWTANAGPDQTITLPINSVSLTGTSSDPTTYIASYAWSKTSGPAGGNVSSSWLKTITLTGLTQGVYNYQLQITDINGVISIANVKVTVNPVQSSASWSANAGPDQTITLPINGASLTGSSSDPNIYIAGYTWSKISGPTGGDVTSYWQKTITVTGLTQGVYNYQLQITDINGVISTANVKITVNSVQSSASWSANAGPDQTITLPINGASLTGSSSDPNTYIAGYTWSKISGPAGGDVTSYWQKTITVTGLTQGVYNYQLKITDNNGTISTANVKVTVYAPQNSGSWVANAGPDQIITLPINGVSLTGSSTDPHTYIAGYFWTKTSGPAGGDVTSYWLKSITLTGLSQGVYTYQLQITDDKGFTSNSNVKVTVISAGARTSGNAVSESTISTNGNSVSIPNATNMITSSPAQNLPLALNSLKIYPNPVNEVTTLEINIPEPNSEVMVTITDMNGATVYKKQINSGYGLLKQQINMSGFTKGVYGIAVILNGKEKQTLKVIKL